MASTEESFCFRIRGIRKTYRLPNGTRIEALRGLNVDIPWGARVGVVGHSGAGKSTLLHLLGMLDEPDTVAGADVLFRELGRPTLSYTGATREGAVPRSMAERARLAKQVFGFVFQRGHLLHHLSAGENVALKLLLSGRPAAERKARARSFLEALGLEGRQENRAHELSGGEAQRVAVLRAVISNPSVLFADEPTGNLDHDAAQAVLKLLRDWQEAGTPEEPRTLLLVTHQLKDACEHCTHFVILKEGAQDGELVARKNLPLDHVEAATELLRRMQGPARQGNAVQLPSRKEDGKVRPPGWSDLLGLALADLLRREHFWTTMSNGLILLFVMLLALVGLALSDGMNRQIGSELSRLHAVSFTVNAQDQPDGNLGDDVVATLEGLRLANGQLAFPPEMPSVRRYNQVSRQFRFYKEGNQPGELILVPAHGRTALPDDLDLREVTPQGFSGSQAAEIVVTRDFLVAVLKAPEDAPVIYLDFAGEAILLRVRGVVDTIRSGFPFILPDGYHQILDHKHQLMKPPGRGFYLCGVPNAKVLRDKVTANEELVEQLQGSSLELLVEEKKDRLLFQVTDSNLLPHETLEGLKNGWRTLLSQQNLIQPSKVFFESVPAPDLPVPAPTYGRATLRVRQIEDILELEELLKPSHLNVPSDVLNTVKLLLNIVRPITLAIGGLVIVALFVGVLNLAVTMAQRVREKAVEIGILKANGMSVGQLSLLFVLEGLLIVLVVVALAFALAWLVAWVLNSRAVAAGWPPLLLYPTTSLLWAVLPALLLGPLVCWLATLWQARKPPAEVVA